MNVYDLNNLKRDVAQNNLYNFFDATFQYFITTLYQYQVKQNEEMRIDLVCNSIYGNVDYCDFILDLNNIDNPLNIMNNDILLYVPSDKIQYFRLDETTAKTLRNTFLNASKISKQDPKRASYVENNYSLPPTFLEVPAESVKIVNGKIILGGNT